MKSRCELVARTSSSSAESVRKAFVQILSVLMTCLDSPGDTLCFGLGPAERDLGNAFAVGFRGLNVALDRGGGWCNLKAGCHRTGEGAHPIQCLRAWARDRVHVL